MSTQIAVRLPDELVEYVDGLVRPGAGSRAAVVASTVKGLSTEVSVGPANGLDRPCVVSCDNIITIHKAALGRPVGFLFERQEHEPAAAVLNAFALRPDGIS